LGGWELLDHYLIATRPIVASDIKIAAGVEEERLHRIYAEIGVQIERTPVLASWTEQPSGRRVPKDYVLG
jgi:hypothetical protein